MKDRRKIEGVVALMVTAAVLTIALAAVTRAPAATGTAAVGIKNFKFSPPVLTVPVGATVTWTNQDEDPHTITSATGAFTSTGLSHDETFTQTFRARGTYQYFCALHPQMRATVLVK